MQRAGSYSQLGGKVSGEAIGGEVRTQQCSPRAAICKATNLLITLREPPPDPGRCHGFQRPGLPPHTVPACSGHVCTCSCPLGSNPLTVCLRVQSHRWPYNVNTLLSTAERYHPPLGQTCSPRGDDSEESSAGPQPHKCR